MSRLLQVIRTPRYDNDLMAIGEYIEQHNADAAYEMVRLLERQVDSLADPNSLAMKRLSALWNWWRI
ncbi:MAG: hypothetical protein IPN06_06150 [Burkholderiales bacterium]|nr:hypothetical protein [Burkholderiales bacterium]